MGITISDTNHKRPTKNRNGTSYYIKYLFSSIWYENPGAKPFEAEALLVGLKDLIAISNGSACTSSSYTPSHVLQVMDLDDDRANGCVRSSWRHLTPPVDREMIADRIHSLR